MIYNYKLFATSYGSGNYSTTTYSGQTQTSTGTNTGNSGGLADTGYDVIIPIALGVALIIAGVILLIKRAKRKK